MKTNTGQKGFTTQKHKGKRGLIPRKGGWRIRYMCALRHTHTESFRYKPDAEAALWANRRKRKDDPTWCPKTVRLEAQEAARAAQEEEAARITVEAFTALYLEDWKKRPRSRSLKTTTSELVTIVKALGPRKLDSITRDDALGFLQMLKAKGLGSATVNRFQARLSSLFSYAVEKKIITENPATRLPLYEVPQEKLVYLGLDDHVEEEALRAALPPALRPLFDTSLDTGVRWSELLAIRWRDLDPRSNSVTIPRAKGGRGRTIPLTARVQSLLVDLEARLLQHPEGREAPIFTCRQGASDFFDAAVTRAKAALRREGRSTAKLDGFTWHCLRHSFASRLVASGVDLYVVSQLLGHSSMKMTAKYAHLSPNYLRAAVARLEPKVNLSESLTDQIPAH